MASSFLRPLVLPQRRAKCAVAFSGGPDSLATLNYLLRGGKVGKVIHFDHGTSFAAESLEYAREVHNALCPDVPLLVYKYKGATGEANWSKWRRVIACSETLPVFTGHHLEDATEWYMLQCMRGHQGTFMPASGATYKPFLTATREQLHTHLPAEFRGINDPTNNDAAYCPRNWLRGVLAGVPDAIDPRHIVRKHYLQELKNWGCERV